MQVLALLLVAVCCQHASGLVPRLSLAASSPSHRQIKMADTGSSSSQPKEVQYCSYGVPRAGQGRAGQVRWVQRTW